MQFSKISRRKVGPSIHVRTHFCVSCAVVTDVKVLMLSSFSSLCDFGKCMNYILVCGFGKDRVPPFKGRLMWDKQSVELNEHRAVNDLIHIGNFLLGFLSRQNFPAKIITQIFRTGHFTVACLVNCL